MKRLSTIILILFFIFPLFANPFKSDISLVVIDAGHGGKDPGAVSGKIEEKDIVLSVSTYLYDALKDKVNCVLTRDRDEYLSLQERCDFANSQDFDVNGFPIFISLHVNAASSSSASGYEIYVKDEQKRLALLSSKTSNRLISIYAPYNNTIVNSYINSVNSHLAALVSSSINKAFPEHKNRGVKEGDLWVLNQTFMPSLLIEIGFITNEEDRAKLTNINWQKKMADAIASAILNY